jgi:hypothetical protein
MTSIASTNIEILVHTTAPSGGQDDARYRALARAYMRFEPETRRNLREDSSSNEVDLVGSQAQSQLQQELFQPTQERESAASYQPEEVEEEEASTGHRSSLTSEILDLSSHAGLMPSPRLSFNSVLDNIDSPVFRRLVTRDEHVSRLGSKQHSQDSSDSWRPPPSSVADSQPENDRPVPVFTSPSRILELYLPKSAAQEPSPQLGIREPRDHETEAGSISADQDRMSESFESSRIPSSPSPNKGTRRGHVPVREGQFHDVPSAQDPALISKRKWPELSSGGIHTSSAPLRPSNNSAACSDGHLPSLPTSPRKRHCTKTSSSENIGTTTTLTSSQIMKALRSSPPSTDIPSPWSNLLEIRPAPPTTSTADLDPQTFITDTLHQLAAKTSAARHFRPVSTIRDLRPMERGYWLLNCESWDDGLRKRCWHFLGNCIGKNFVGWGVWCMRDAEHSTIRVYCWGIVVPYIFLLLCLASEGKIMKIGASWIGGDGQPIIKMPS